MVIPECSPASAARTQNSERPRRQHAYDRSRNPGRSDSSLWFWFLHDRLGRMVLQIPKTTRHLPLTRQEQLISRFNRLRADRKPTRSPAPSQTCQPPNRNNPFPTSNLPLSYEYPSTRYNRSRSKKQKPRTTSGALPIWNEYFAETTAPRLSKISTLPPNTHPSTNLSRKE